MTTMKYKGYTGSVEVSVEDNLVHGKVQHIRDLLTYQADAPVGIKAAFEEAIDDYLLDCKDQGIEPDKPYKGSFNVRVTPELHREIASFANRCGVSLNEYVSSVLKCHEVLGRGGQVPSAKHHYLVVAGVRDRKGEIQNIVETTRIGARYSTNSDVLLESGAKSPAWIASKAVGTRYGQH